MMDFLPQDQFCQRRRVDDRRSTGERRRLGLPRRKTESGRLATSPVSLLGGIGPPGDRRAKTEATLRVEALLDLCEALAPDNTGKLLHDLREYQLELEARNQELSTAKLALEAARARYADLYDQAPVGYCSLNAQQRIVEANLRFAHLLGIARGELLERPISAFVHPEDSEVFERHGRHLLGSALPQACELRMVKADGSAFWAHLECQISGGAEVEPLFYLVMTDASERRRVEAEHAQIQKAESLARMAGAIAHVFNNQLQVVMGSLDLLSELRRGADFDRYLASGKQAAERAAEVSRLLLVYLGKTSAHRTPCLLSELCRESLDAIRGAQPGNVEIQADLPAPGPLVSADPGMIQQVVINLITNAWEAVDGAPGHIHLRLRIWPREAISSRHRFPVDWQAQEPEYACLEVADTGVGITEAAIENLFDPFYTTKFQGRGLGLPVVLGIVQAHGAAISVAQAGRRGTAFRIYFPLAHSGE